MLETAGTTQRRSWQCAHRAAVATGDDDDAGVDRPPASRLVPEPRWAIVPVSMKRQILLTCAALCCGFAQADDWQKEVVFRASFDGSPDARVAGGDPKLYHAASYKDGEAATPGLDGTDVRLAPGAGRTGDALHFTRKNTKAVFFKAQGNVPFEPNGWSATVSFWLKLDPDRDLEPGWCDPLQLTDKAYNDCAIWVDFTKDDKPRHFRLGVFGALKSWDPTNKGSDGNPAFDGRLVRVSRPPFTRERWTHVAITLNRLGRGAGAAELFLDGKSQGAARNITEPFPWDITKASLRLGIDYVGYMDDLAIFRRPLNAAEIAALAAARDW